MISAASLDNRLPTASLGEVAEFLDSRRRPITEADRRPGPYPYYGANGQQDSIDDFLFDEPLVLLAEDGGHFDDPDRGIAYRIHGKTWVNNHAHVLRPTDRVDGRYLCRVLENYDVRRFVTGTTRGKLTQRSAAEIPIPLPPLTEQRRVADILDRADRVRAARRTALTKLAAIARAVFRDSFGDPLHNPMEWPRVPLGDLLSNIDSGWSPKCLDRPANGDEWGILKLGAVTWCEYDSTQNKALSPDAVPRPGLEVKRGDLLFTRKNTHDLVAACAVVWDTPAHLLMPDLIFRLRLRADAPVDPVFLHQLLIYPTKRRDIQKLAGGSAGSMPNISKARLASTPIELPPVDMQREFGRQIAGTLHLKSSLLASSSSLDALFGSLQSRAFRGQL